jgi:polygalacturonase
MDQNDKACGVSVTSFGARGDGVTDDGTAIQAALDSGEELIVIPFGNYLVGRTLRIGSNTRLRAHRRAVLRLASGAARKPDDFLIANKNEEYGDSNIFIEGGIWDYNNVGNPRKSDLFDQSGATGTMINFRNVRGLTLYALTLKDPECYYIRLCQVDDFLVEEIEFESKHITNNQDGVHLGGFCKNGFVRNLKASPESPNDDFVALNADDSMVRLQNTNMLCGPIENVVISGLVSKECHTFVRLLSVNSPIRNIEIDNVRGGCRAFVINMDAARYCRTPLFKDQDHPNGVGQIENVRISNVDTYAVNPGKGLFCLETNTRNFCIRNHRFDARNGLTPHGPAFFIGNMGESQIQLRAVSGSQIRGLREASTCKNVRVHVCPDPYRTDVSDVSAHLAAGENLILPAGDFDELRIDTKL